MNVSFHNVTSLPANPEPGGIYMVGTTTKSIVIIDNNGNQCSIGTSLYKHEVKFQHDMVSDTNGTITIISATPTAYTAISELPDGLYYTTGTTEIGGDVIKLYSITLRQNAGTYNTEVILIGAYSTSVAYGYQDWAFGDVSLVSDTVSQM